MFIGWMSTSSRTHATKSSIFCVVRQGVGESFLTRMIPITSCLKEQTSVGQTLCFGAVPLSPKVLDQWGITVIYIEMESGNGILLRKITTFWPFFPLKNAFWYLSFYLFVIPNGNQSATRPWENIQKLMNLGSLCYIVLRTLS